MKIGVRFSRIKVDDGLIIEGHHRYLASLLGGVCLEVPPTKRTTANKISRREVVEIVKED
jgi:hypothetical protein